MELILFWTFSALMLLCALLVLVSRDPVNSAMFLILLFLCMAGLFLLLQAFFIAVIQVLVYGGAIMVLFLFVIMLLDLDEPRRRMAKTATIAGAFAVFVALGAIFVRILGHERFPEVSGAPPGTLRDVIVPLFRDHLVTLELIALLMLTSIVGVVLISKREVK